MFKNFVEKIVEKKNVAMERANLGDVLITGKYERFQAPEKIADLVVDKRAQILIIDGVKEIFGDALIAGFVHDLSSLEKVYGDLVVAGEVVDMPNLKFVGGDLVIKSSGKIINFGNVKVQGDQCVLGSIGKTKEDFTK